jgi:hypothetical protein
MGLEHFGTQIVEIFANASLKEDFLAINFSTYERRYKILGLSNSYKIKTRVVNASLKLEVNGKLKSV